MTGDADVLIVGGGHAGAQAAIALRQQGFAGSIMLVGAEPELPYERPPLSKEYFAGDKNVERIRIRPAAFWAERSVSMQLGQTVIAVDPVAKTATTDCGRTYRYGSMIWAAGGHARTLPLPGADLPGVMTLRTRADADAMVAAAARASAIVVIGGGYIGLESAAVLAKTGKQVTLVEALDRVLARVTGEQLSRFFEAEHRAHGVDIRLNAGVAAIEGDTHLIGVRLASGETIAADLVLVGIGLVPAVAPLIAAGAEGGNGVRVDGQCRTSLPDIYAIGDCALHESMWADSAELRLESVQNANDMATVAVHAIIGTPHRYEAVPWFWSNQYDLKLQTVGLSAGHDHHVLRGDPAARRFSVVYLKGGRVIALDCVNAVKDYAQGKALVAARAQIDESMLADVAMPLKAMLPG